MTRRCGSPVLVDFWGVVDPLTDCPVAERWAQLVAAFTADTPVLSSLVETIGVNLSGGASLTFAREPDRITLTFTPPTPLS